MSFLNWRKFYFRWTPDDYTANSVEAVMNVSAGMLIGPIVVRTETAFNGTNSNAVFELGDGGDVDRFVDAGELDEHTAGNMVRAIGAANGGYVLYRSHLYTSDDTIDVNFTADTGGDGTAGAVLITIYWTRVWP